MTHLKKITVTASAFVLTGCCMLQNPDYASQPVACLKSFDEMFKPTEYRGRVALINCVDEACNMVSLVTDEGHNIIIPKGGLDRPIPLGTPVYANDKKVCIDLGHDTDCARY